MTNLALIGYRGTGKTTVAQVLAQRLGWQWVDADVELERQAGRTIKQIFADGGELEFRDLESNVVAELCERQRMVIALGGGAILRSQNRAVIKARCQTAWLVAEPATIYQRITADVTTTERRPNLTSAGGLAEIETLLAARAPFYRECAGCSVVTDDRSPESIADEILACLGTALGMTK